MNSTIKTFSVGLLMLLLTVAPVYATTVSIADVTLEPSGVVTIPIMVNEITDYGSGTINIEYNPSVVHVTDVTSSSDSQVAAYNPNNTMGFVRISASNTYGVSGDIAFANVEFTAVGTGSTPLNLDVVSLYNRSFNKISPSVIHGSISTPLMPGDVDGDGELTTADVIIVLQMAVRGEYLAEADVSGDYIVTSLDALMILQADARDMEL